MLMSIHMMENSNYKILNSVFFEDVLSTSEPALSWFEAPAPMQIRACDVTPLHNLHDLWEDAKMGEVVEYLRGGMFLRLPEEWQSCASFSYNPSQTEM